MAKGHFPLGVRTAVVAAALGCLVGCASLNTLGSDVSSYGEWPAGRSPGSYTFERLPSQQARADQQAELEVAARSALSLAGFTPAAEGARADVVVQLGARISRADRSPWDDPLWWRWGAGYWHRPGWRGYGYGYGGFGYPGYFDSPIYEREVAMLIRDGRDGGVGKPLYETHASNDGNSLGGTAVLAAMYEAALKDFPLQAVNPRRVNVELAATGATPRPPASAQ